MSGSGFTTVPSEAVRAQLERVVAGSALRASPRLRELLSFLVEETLAGRRERLKGYTIGVEALGREPSFDPRVDPLVSIQAGRLRRALERHYQAEGADDPIQIEIPKGAYLPVFLPKRRVAAALPGREATLVRPLPSSRAPCVAVLPFADLSADGGHDYFAVGLTEELAIALSRFDDVRVVSSQSTQRYKGVSADVRDVGRDLGARYVLAGTMHRDGTELKVTATLSDTATGLVAWGDRYHFDLTAANVFHVQDKITESVVARIAGTFGVIPRAVDPECLGRRTEELDAYDAIQLVHHFTVHVNAETFARAFAALERATERDPGYGLAWAMLAGQYANSYALDFPTGVEKPLDYALELSRKALALDPDCQRVHWNAALVHFHRHEVRDCLAEIERTIALNPNNATLLGQAGWGMALCGRWTQGLDLLDKSIRLNPYHPGYFFFARYLDRYRAGDYEGALVQARLICLALNYWDPLMLAAVFGSLGRIDEACVQAKRLLDRQPDFRTRGRELIRCYVFVDELDERLIEGLRKAGVDVD